MEDRIQDLWGSSAADVWAAGENGFSYQHGRIWHFDGAAWSEVSQSSSEPLTALWGTAHDDIWAFGGHTFLHYKNKTWSEDFSIGLPSMREAWGISGQVWAVGEDSLGKTAVMMHYNGAAWSPVALPTANKLYGIWGTSACDIWVVGEQGTILHYH